MTNKPTVPYEQATGSPKHGLISVFLTSLHFQSISNLMAATSYLT